MNVTQKTHHGTAEHLNCFCSTLLRFLVVPSLLEVLAIVSVPKLSDLPGHGALSGLAAGVDGLQV